MKSCAAILGIALLALTGCQSSYQAPPTAEWIAFMQSPAEPERIVLAADSDDPETIRQRQLVEAALERCDKSGRIEKMYPDWRGWIDYRLVRTESAVLISLPNQRTGVLYFLRFDKSTGRLEKSEELLMHYLPESKAKPEQSKEPTAGEAIAQLMALVPTTDPNTWVLLEPRADKSDMLRKRQLVEIVLDDVECTGQIEKHNPRWKYTMAYALERRGSEFSIEVLPYPDGIGIGHSIQFDGQTGAYLRIAESIGCP